MRSRPTTPPAEGRAYRAWVLFLLFQVQAFNISDRHVFGLLIQPIKQEFGLSDSALGALTGIYFVIFYTVVGLPVARWADRGVRRSIIALSLLLWSGMTVACGLAQSTWQLVLARVGVGIGEAGGSPPSHSLLTDYFPLERRGRAMGLMSMGGSVGIILSLWLGGWVAKQWGWREAFLALGIPGVVLAVLVQFSLREPPRGRYDPPGSHAAPVSLGETLAFLLRVPAFLHISLAGSLYSFAGYGAAVWNAAFLMRVHGLDIQEAGASLALRSAVFATLSVVAGGFLGDWLGRRDVRWYQWMPALGGLAMIPFTAAFLLSPDVQTALWFIMPGAFFGGLWAAPGHAMVQSLVLPQMRATASALMLVLFNLIGFGLGPWCVGLLNDALEPRYGPEAVRYSLLAILVGSAWGALHNGLAGRTLASDLRARDPA